MFRLAVLFLCVAVAAAFFGHGGLAGDSGEGTRLFCFVFLGLAAMCFVSGWLNRPAAA